MFSEPVIGEKFFGREEVLELLNKRASALRDGYRQNIALTGQSLAGKTSIILHFLSAIKDENFIPIYVEVIKEPFQQFANKFIATMLYNSFEKIGEEPDVDISRLLDKAHERLPRTYSAIKNITSLIEHGSFEEAYSSLLTMTSVLKVETGFSCIVILDEFDNLEKVGIKNPFLGFGKVIMVQKDTMYIVSSSRDAAIKKILSEKLALLFGNFEIIKVSNFGLKTARDFIETRLGGFDIEDPLIKFLISFTDGNPFYLAQIIRRAKEIAIDRMSSNIDAGIIATAATELLFNSGGSIHQYLTNFILELLDTKCRETQLSILVSIAGGKNKQQEIARALKIKKAEVAKNLVRLIEAGLISKNGIFYRIDDYMLGFWLKNVYQKRRDMLVGGTFDKDGFFSRYMQSYIAEFVEHCDVEIIKMVAELFGRFSNELVQVESRQMRLPHFTKSEIRPFPDSGNFVLASFRNNFWIAQPFEHCVSENDIVNYIRNSKTLGYRISNNIIMPLKGIDENARLLAKELKISIWDDGTVNMLLGFYGKNKLVIP